MNNPNNPLPNRNTVLSSNLNRSKNLLQKRIVAIRALIHDQFHGGYGGWPLPPRPRWLESQENKIDRAQKLIAEINRVLTIRHSTSNRWAGAARPRRHLKPNTLREIERLENHTAVNIPAWTRYYTYKQGLARKLKLPSFNAVTKLVNENKLTRNALAHYYAHQWMMKAMMRSRKRKRNNT